jgi:hypothetical protein
MADTRPRHHRPHLLLLYTTAFVSVIFLLFLLVSPSSFASNSCSNDNKQNAIALASLKRFHTHNDPFCQRLPDASATYLWGQLNLPQPKLSARASKRGIVNAPSPTSLQRLFSKLEDSSAPLDILVLLSTKDDKWPQALYDLFSTAVAPNLVRIHATTAGLPDSSTADIIIDARAASEMKQLQSDFADLVITPDASNHLHTLKQRRIRSILLETVTCPLLILVNDTPFSEKLFSGSVYTRTVQRLAHWYQLGHVRSVSTSSTESKLEQVLAFAFLEWTIDYCSSPPTQNTVTTSVLLPGVQQLIESVVPPPLKLDTTWQTISGQWEKARDKQQRTCSAL